MALITYLVEDNDTILTNLIETLQEITEVKVMGCGATQAEASRWLSLHDGHWHLAIVDLFLKEGSGMGVLTGCRNREPYQKVVLLTNYATPEIRKRAMALGLMPYLTNRASLKSYWPTVLSRRLSTKNSRSRKLHVQPSRKAYPTNKRLVRC